MVTDYRIDAARRAAPAARWLTPQLWAQALLVVAILYTFLQYFTWVQYNPLDMIAGELTDLFYAEAADAAEGNLLNRFFWLVMLIGTVPLLWRYQRRVGMLLSRNMLLVAIMALALLSATWALSPMISVRRFAQLAIITAFAIGIVVTLPSPRQFVQCMLIATGIILVLDLAIIPAYPWLAFDAVLSAYEGVHSHKNLAGSFLMIAGIFWFFATWQFRGLRRKLAGMAVMAVIVVLLVMSQSKTSQALLPVSILVSWLLAAASRRGPWWFSLTMLFVVLSVLTAVVPLGVMSPLAIVDVLYGDATLTGRTEIWSFVMRMIGDRPLHGFGYGSFWGLGGASPNVRFGNDLLMSVNQAHSGYLDIAAQLGLIGLGLAVALLLMPFLRLFLIAHDAEADGMGGAGVAIMVAIMIAGLVHNVTESSILRAGHATWFFMLFALLYLSAVRLRVRYRLQQKKEEAAREAAATDGAWQG